MDKLPCCPTSISIPRLPAVVNPLIMSCSVQSIVVLQPSAISPVIQPWGRLNDEFRDKVKMGSPLFGRKPHGPHSQAFQATEAVRLFATFTRPVRSCCASSQRAAGEATTPAAQMMVSASNQRVLKLDSVRIAGDHARRGHDFNALLGQGASHVV